MKKENRKGQITVFIILGFVILIAVGFMLYLKEGVKEKEVDKIIKLPSEIMPVKVYVESCVEEIAKQGIYFISLQGGYYETPSLSKTFFGVKIPYYWYNQGNKMPTKDIIEQELSNYIKNKLPECTNNFTNFEEMGYKFELSEISVLSNIALKNVVVKVNYPIKVYIGSDITKLDKFTSSIEINLNEIYNFLEQIIEEQEKTPDSIPLGFISYLAYENNFTFEYIDLEGWNILYSLIFEQDNDESLIYNFLSHYNWSELTTTNQTVSIEPIPEFNITEPKIIEYQVKATGANLTFYDYTDIFDIDPKTGWIVFDSSGLSNGERNILIKAVDNEGNEDFAFMRINVNYPNQLPIIQPIGNLTAYVGQEFTYKVNATDPTNKFLFFLDDTSLFDINLITGEIKFTPTLEGNYSIKITAVNSAGHSFGFMRLEVK